MREIKNKNDCAWEELFDVHDILKKIEFQGSFIISADDIRKYREPRLMAKFDHKKNLPKIFTDNGLSILPISRGEYILSHFDTYKEFEKTNPSIMSVALPDCIKSLEPQNISSEAIAINSALASGMFSDFLDESVLFPTVSGRMSSRDFSFTINNTKKNQFELVNVSNSQIEIDIALEGEKSLSLIEAKIDLSDDFLIRQLYYPFRLWQQKLQKKVRPIFLVYTNGIYNLYEYKFLQPDNYNSLELINHKKYTVEDSKITFVDINDIYNMIKLCKEPHLPFPQANNFDRIINLCELLASSNLSRSDVTSLYDFDARQTNYYSDAARYLGLLDKNNIENEVIYSLSKNGQLIINLPYKKRQLAFINCILEHEVFYKCFDLFLRGGKIPQKEHIVQIMKKSNLHEVIEDSTFIRRASTISGWLKWIERTIVE